MDDILIKQNFSYIKGFVDLDSEPPYAYIEMISVPKILRRHGIASALLHKFEQICSSKGARSISGWVNPANLEAAGFFFENNGYTLSSVGNDIELDKEI